VENFMATSGRTMRCKGIVSTAAVCLALVIGTVGAEEQAPRSPLVRVVDLDVGETQELTLCNGRKVSVRLVDFTETRDSVRSAVRRADLTVQVDGKNARLGAAMYELPITLGQVQIDCSVTKGVYSNTNADAWGLVKDARLRLWPADSPLQEPDTFVYPAKQRWFASGTQMANEPSFIDGFESPAVRKIYYHSGEDIGGAEGMVEVVAATDALAVSAGLDVLAGHRRRALRRRVPARQPGVVLPLQPHAGDRPANRSRADDSEG
jgi:hypothetical protein